MAEGIQITLGEVSGIANTIRNLNSSMTACLDEIHSLMRASTDMTAMTDKRSELILIRHQLILRSIAL